MTTMRSLALLLSLLLAMSLLAESKVALSDLAWMTGEWGATLDGVEMEETWSTAAGGMLIGMHRDISKKGTFFEFLRIVETKDGIVFMAQPSGQPPTPFRLAEAGANNVVFVNPDNDFPKRILYWLEDAQLCARVQGDGNASEQWCWARRK
jgi:hypothetical protein